MLPRPLAFPRPPGLFEAETSNASANLQLMAALGVSICAVLLFLQNNNFPLGVHPDETKKVGFILGGEQDFLHPVLMLQVSRLANIAMGYTDLQDIARLGRTLSAAFAGIYVFASYLLARRSFSHVESLVLAAVVAIAPLTAIHAQALKEDIYAAAPLMLSLVALISLASRPDRISGALFGIAAGLAISAKYVALLIFVVALLVPLVCEIENRRKVWMALALSAGVACVVALAVNAPALFAPGSFAGGVVSETKHVLGGHNGDFVSPFGTYLAHYAREGLIKGLGAPLAVTGLLGMVLAAARWRAIGNALRIPLLFGAVWYFAHELAPMKPGVSRYMAPMGAVVVLFAVFFIRVLVTRIRAFAGWAPGVASVAILVLVLWPASRTFVYLLSSDSDTSLTAQNFANSLGGRVFLDDGVRYPPTGELDGMAGRRESSAEVLLEKLQTDWDYAVTRKITGVRVGLNDERQKARQGFYEVLYRSAYIEIEHTWREYEFRNRRVRIVALGGDGADMIARAKTWAWPGTARVSLFPAKE